MHRWNTPVREHQIGEVKQREQLRLVLGQLAVAGPAMPEQVLEHMKRILDLRPATRSGSRGSSTTPLLTRASVTTISATRLPPLRLHFNRLPDSPKWKIWWD